jgi:outer membrane protein TolC
MTPGKRLLDNFARLRPVGFVQLTLFLGIILLTTPLRQERWLFWVLLQLMFLDALLVSLSASARTWSIGVGILQPIFNAGRIHSINEAAAARQLQTLARHEQIIQTAFREVSDALVGCRKNREQRVQQALLVEALADSAALAKTRFLGGIDSYLQVLDAERQLFDAELELTRVRANELLSTVQLYKALGGGWQPDQPRQARPLTRPP